MRSRLAALALALLALPVAAVAERSPQANYMIHCQGCHLPDGAGRPPAVPSLVTDMAPFLAVEGGRAYLVQVPGTANSPLDDAETAALLNWMLATYAGASLPDGFTPYTAAEVARHRAGRLINAAARRDELLAALRH